MAQVEKEGFESFETRITLVGGKETTRARLRRESDRNADAGVRPVASPQPTVTLESSAEHALDTVVCYGPGLDGLALNREMEKMTILIEKKFECSVPSDVFIHISRAEGKRLFQSTVSPEAIEQRVCRPAFSTQLSMAGRTGFEAHQVVFSAMIGA